MRRTVADRQKAAFVLVALRSQPDAEDLDADELALAQQVDISDAATAPNHVGREVNIVMKNCGACPLDYVVPLPDADVDLTKDQGAGK